MRWGVHKIDFRSIGMTIIVYGNMCLFILAVRKELIIEVR